MSAASSPAPGGPACEHCLVPNKVAAVAAGSMGELAGRACYVAKGSGKSAAVVVMPDVFGHSFVNCQAVADAIALASGATVFVPDVLEGDAIPPDGFDRATFPAWRERHTDAAVVPLAQAAVAALRAKGYTRIGSIGYCFGARHSVLLARAKLRGGQRRGGDGRPRREGPRSQPGRPQRPDLQRGDRGHGRSHGDPRKYSKHCLGPARAEDSRGTRRGARHGRLRGWRGR